MTSDITHLRDISRDNSIAARDITIAHCLHQRRMPSSALAPLPLPAAPLHLLPLPQGTTCLCRTCLPHAHHCTLPQKLTHTAHTHTGAHLRRLRYLAPQKLLTYGGASHNSQRIARTQHRRAYRAAHCCTRVISHKTQARSIALCAGNIIAYTFVRKHR